MYLFLFAMGFEQEIYSFYGENAKADEYLIVIACCFLLLLYIVPFLFAEDWIGRKLGVGRNFFLLALASGMFLPGWLAGYGNDYGQQLMGKFCSWNFVEDWGLTFIAPAVEEPLKLLTLFLLLTILGRKQWKYFFVGGMGVGMGFQIMEDISYIASEGFEEINESVPLVLQRISGGIASHWTYTALAATGIYLLFRGKQTGMAACAGKTGIGMILFVFLNHGIWDSPLCDLPGVSALLAASLMMLYLSVLQKGFHGVFCCEQLSVELCHRETGRRRKEEQETGI